MYGHDAANKGRECPREEPAVIVRAPEHEENFRLAKENIRHRDMSLRAYREGVTDAFEVGFLAEPLNPDDYMLDDPTGDLGEAVGNEET